jgi:4-amino-4-deoxy-L-arabinose transferase-like glycosyltransferase
VVWTALALGSVRQKSATYDEPLHLVSGHAALTRGDHRVDPSHPPLARMFAALPAVWGGVAAPDLRRIDAQSGQEWLGSNQGKSVAREFLYGNPDPDALLWRARLMILPFGVGLGALLFAATRAWLGIRPAYFALAFYTITPTIMGHGALVTTDTAAAALIFAALFCLWRTCERQSPARIAALAVAVSAAVLVKFSALVLLPVGIALLVVAVRAGQMVPKAAIRIVALVGVTTMVAIWAAYGFRYAPSGTDGWYFSFHDDPAYIQVAPLASWLTGLIDGAGLLPNAFSQGLLYGHVSSQQPAYLLGEYSTEGWWYYFPIAFLVKTPLGLLTLFVFGAGVLSRRLATLGSVRSAFIVLPSMTFTALAVTSSINIGVRHILPVYPFVLVAAATGADRLWASRHALARPVLVGALVFWLEGFVSAYPNTLTYFNRAAGGPAAGLNYLADSNLDWGQHLPALKGWMEQRGISHVNLAYFGQADPDHYGINCTYLPSVRWTEPRVVGPPKLPGFVAISATTLSGTYLPPQWRRFYAGFQALEPVATVGHSILVFWAESWPEGPPIDPIDAGAVNAELLLADGLTGPLKWPRHALNHYRAYLQERSADAAAVERYGRALLATGDAAAGLDQLRRSVALDRDRSSGQLALAAALVDAGDRHDAEPHARMATLLAPNDADAWYQLGRATEGTHGVAEAESHSLRAVSLAPRHEAAAALRRLREAGRR